MLLIPLFTRKNPLMAVALLAVFLACGADSSREQSEAAQTAKRSPAEESANPAPAGPQLENAPVRIRYFYSAKYRCYSCRLIEEYTNKAVTETFAVELGSGKVEFSQVDIDLEENQRYIQDYKLYTKSVIVSQYQDGREVRWKNLDKVWTLLRNEAGFKAYVVNEIKSYL